MFFRFLLGIALACSILTPAAAETLAGGSAAIPSNPIPPEAHRVAEFLRRMGRAATADRFEQDLATGRVTFGKLDPGTNGQTGRWISNGAANGTEYSAEMLNQVRPSMPDSSPVLIGWAITVEHEYVHTEQSSPSQTPRYENPAWAHSLDVVQTWIRKARSEMSELERAPDSPEKAAQLRDLANLTSGLRDAHADTVSGIREGIAGQTIDAKGPWPTVDLSGSDDIDKVLKSTNDYSKRWTQDIREAQMSTERHVKEKEQEARIEKQRAEAEQKAKQEQIAKEAGEKAAADRSSAEKESAKTLGDKTGAENDPGNRDTADERGKSQGADGKLLPEKTVSDRAAAEKAAAEQAAAEEAARRGKEKAIAELRAAIPKARSAIAQLKAIKEYGYAAQVEAELAKLLAQYRVLTGLEFQASKGGNKSRPGKQAEPAPSEGGVMTHADGSRTVLTYTSDASGNRVPVTTEYDRDGKAVSKTTVDSAGRSVPVK